MAELKLLVYVDRGARGSWAISLAQELAQGLRAHVILLTAERNLKLDPDLLTSAASKIESATECETTLKTPPGPARKAILEDAGNRSIEIMIFLFKLEIR